MRLLTALAVFFFAALPALAQTGPVHVLTIEGAISPAAHDYLRAGIAKAERNKAQLVVIKLNTPGGLLTSTRDMATAILQSPVPVAVYVYPPGGHAASAGTFLLYAAHIAAMAPGTNVGAATPVTMGGDDTGKSQNQKNLDNKAQEDTAAFIRSLAEIRGRDPLFGEQAVTKAASITASEAVKKNVADVLADDLSSLLAAVDGKTVTLHSKEKVRLALTNPALVDDAPDWRTQFLSFIADPTIAFVLLNAGIYGLIIEARAPGLLLPGIVGAICLFLGLYAMNILSVNAAGLGLVVLGLVMLGLEVFITSFGLLAVGGVVALVVGASIMFDETTLGGLALNWGIVGGLITSLFLLLAGTGYLAFAAQRRKPHTGVEAMTGRSVRIRAWQGCNGTVDFEGEIWQAVSPHPIDAENAGPLTVYGIDGMVLKVKPEEKES